MDKRLKVCYNKTITICVVLVTEKVVVIYDIGLTELEVTERVIKDGDYIYYATVTSEPKECPDCGSLHFVKHKKHDRRNGLIHLFSQRSPH